MKYYNIKNREHFGLFGSDVLEEPGFHRFSQSEVEQIKQVNGDAAWHSLSSTGIQVKFMTNSKEINVKVALSMPSNMDNMPSIGQCGVDLYYFDEERKQYLLLDVSRFDYRVSEYEVSLGRFHDGLKRKYVLNLPLYIPALEVHIGTEESALVMPDAFLNPGRIAVYGTSIVHGVGISRPGMLFTNILSRWLDKEFLNFGLSGAALGEAMVADFIGHRKNLELLIVDIEANAGVSDMMKQRLPEFIDHFKAIYPNLPIILVSRNLFSMDLYDDDRINLRTFYDKWLRKLCIKYRKQGYNVSYLDGSKFFKGNFTEYTVDGIHPSDLGAYAIAKSYQRAIQKVILH